MSKALILGVFEKILVGSKSYQFTECSKLFNDKCNGLLKKQIDLIGTIPKSKARVFYQLTDDYPVVSVCSLGPENASIDETEQLNEKKENIRLAVAAALKSLRDLSTDFKSVTVDDCSDAQSVAEALYLCDYRYDDLKDANLKRKPFDFQLFTNENTELYKQWNKGHLLAEGQNLARRLGECPSNLMTPSEFVTQISKLAQEVGLKAIIRDKEWAQSKGMGSFLGVSQGSDQPPYFLELHYNTLGNCKPLVIVGKGVCYDSGGYSLKSSDGMSTMRGDMNGAAIAASTLITFSKLKIPANVVALIPLCENLINGKAIKPGDVVRAMNGKTIQVDNTDAEGRLILADALCYSSEFDPRAVVDMATLTGAMSVSLELTACGVWSTCNKLWQTILNSSIDTGDRVWRMPFFNAFTKLMTNPLLADYNNLSSSKRDGSSCTAAAFLKEFVTCPSYMHIDFANVSMYKSDIGYISKGMTGRPFRTIVHFIESYFKENQ